MSDRPSNCRENIIGKQGTLLGTDRLHRCMLRRWLDILWRCQDTASWMETNDEILKLKCYSRVTAVQNLASNPIANANGVQYQILGRACLPAEPGTPVAPWIPSIENELRRRCSSSEAREKTH